MSFNKWAKIFRCKHNAIECYLVIIWFAISSVTDDIDSTGIKIIATISQKIFSGRVSASRKTIRPRFGLFKLFSAGWKIRRLTGIVRLYFHDCVCTYMSAYVLSWLRMYLWVHPFHCFFFRKFYKINGKKVIEFQSQL